MCKKCLLHIYCNRLLIGLCVLFFPQVLPNSHRKLLTAACMAILDSDLPYLTHLTSVNTPCGHFVLQPYGLSSVPRIHSTSSCLRAPAPFFLRSALPPALAMAGCFSLIRILSERPSWTILPKVSNPTSSQSFYHSVLFYCLSKTSFTLLVYLVIICLPCLESSTNAGSLFILFATYFNTHNIA